MVTLDPQSGYLVLINTFTVDPAKAEDLLRALAQATEHGMNSGPASSPPACISVGTASM